MMMYLHAWNYFKKLNSEYYSAAFNILASSYISYIKCMKPIFKKYVVFVVIYCI